MAVEVQVFDFTFKLTDTTGGPDSAGSMPQFGVAAYDVTNAFGCVNIGSTNAGPAIGINQSQGIDPATGALKTVTINSVLVPATPTGFSCEIRLEGISRARVNGATTIGSPLSAFDTNGQVGPGAGGFVGGVIGYGLEAGTTAGDLISLLVNPGLQPALKQLGSVAAPLTNNGSPNTQSSFAHGLGYVPHIVLLVGAGATPTGVLGLSAAADATNIYVKSTVASSTMIAYVA